MKAKDAPHLCPVCSTSYVPSEESMRVPGVGPMLLEIPGVGCIKGGLDWLRVYCHGSSKEDKSGVPDDG